MDLAAPESHFSSEESHERMAETSETALTQTRRFPESQDNLDSGHGSLRSYTYNLLSVFSTLLLKKATVSGRNLLLHFLTINSLQANNANHAV